MMLRLLLSTALCALLGAGPGRAQAVAWPAVKQMIRLQFPEVRPLTVDSLAAWLEDPGRPQPLLLDVRAPDEYAVSHLAGAVRVDPGLEDLAPLEGVAKAAPIVVYCSVGYRSAALARRLQQAGFTNVRNLEGSIFAWANAGHPVYRAGRRVRVVHPYDRLWGLLLDDALHPPEE